MDDHMLRGPIQNKDYHVNYQVHLLANLRNRSPSVVGGFPRRSAVRHGTATTVNKTSRLDPTASEPGVRRARFGPCANLTVESSMLKRIKKPCVVLFWELGSLWPYSSSNFFRASGPLLCGSSYFGDSFLSKMSVIR